MSAFIVDVQTINRMLGALAHRGSDKFYYRMPDGRYAEDYQREDWQKLGQQLHQLNIEAVRQRYGDDHDSLPGPIPTPDPASTIYSPALIPGLPRVRQCQGIKSWQCWHYQCSEGDIPDTELYKWADGLLYSLCRDVVDSLPEYNKAQWA
jgi:hypothetical protein